MPDLICYRCARIAHCAGMRRVAPGRDEIVYLPGILRIEAGDDIDRPPGGPYVSTWGEACGVQPVTVVRGSLVCDRHIDKAVNDV